MKPLPIKYYYRDQKPGGKNPRASALKHAVRVGRMTLRFTDEGMEMLTVATWLRMHGVFFLHPANEAKRHRLEAITLKQLGLEPGASDIIVFDTPPAFPDKKGVVIELKTKKGAVRDTQVVFIQNMRHRGYLGGFAWGAEQAINILKHCGYGRRG